MTELVSTGFSARHESACPWSCIVGRSLSTEVVTFPSGETCKNRRAIIIGYSAATAVALFERGTRVSECRLLYFGKKVKKGLAK